eukprot:5622437-Prorocentrum_lima.AAC.1
MDIGESSQLPVYILLLDWEKAFDRVSHAGLSAALGRLGVPDVLREAVMSLYQQPGSRSTWKRQSA